MNIEEQNGHLVQRFPIETVRFEFKAAEVNRKLMYEGFHLVLKSLGLSAVDVINIQQWHHGESNEDLVEVSCRVVRYPELPILASKDDAKFLTVPMKLVPLHFQAKE